MQLSTEWIEATQRGDQEAREALSAWCLRRAFRLAYVDLGSVPNRPALAEEIASEASLKAVTHLAQFRPGTRFDAWLHGIVRNCIRDHYRCADRTVPHAIYQRWVHDFLAGHAHDLEAVVRRELAQEASEPHPVVLQRIAADLGRCTYRQFMGLTYEGRSDAVLDAVKCRLRAFVGLEWLPLYDRDTAGEWIGTDLPGEDETEALVLQHEFVQQVNDNLADLQPLCRRFLRWYYLDRLRVAEIARIERMNARTAYRRLENCASSFRELLMRGDYFAEFSCTPPAAATPEALR